MAVSLLGCDDHFGYVINVRNAPRTFDLDLNSHSIISYFMQASNTNKNEIMLPVGGEPFWDQDNSEENDQGKNLKSISER